MIGQVGENSVVVTIMEAVRVKVPVNCAFVAEVTRKNNGKSIIILAHHHNAFAIGRVVVNRNFYGFTDQDLGRQMTATVQVFEKMVAGDKKYTAIDYFKADGTRPMYEIKIIDPDKMVTGVTTPVVPIQGTSKFICFKPL